MGEQEAMVRRHIHQWRKQSKHRCNILDWTSDELSRGAGNALPSRPMSSDADCTLTDLRMRKVPHRELRNWACLRSMYLAPSVFTRCT